MKTYFISFLILFSVILITGTGVLAQDSVEPSVITPPTEETLEAKVVGILDEKTITPEFGDTPQLYQRLRLQVTRGFLAGHEITVESGNMPAVNLPRYQVGDQVVVFSSADSDGNSSFYITDYVRRGPMFWLFLIFVIFTVVIGKIRGLTSLFGMLISFAIIFMFILPRILAGSDPVLIAIIGSLFIIPVTFYLSHGLNTKTSVAVIGTLIALVFTGILAVFSVEATKLTGFASEEAAFLQVAKGNLLNVKGLLLAGIIIGVLGVLDDITISQSAVVFQLKQANPRLKYKEIYRQAMDVGQDHISSMVNTLILVYTGAALPLLLLFINNPHPFTEVINYEIVADEIVRTLVGSIGLILSVPITTLLATFAVTRQWGSRSLPPPA